jgi:uncharacterized glyoxalase superfamily protein PhnB
MKQDIVYVSLLVRDYDEVIQFYTKKLDFQVLEDSRYPRQNKRWVVLSPPQSRATTILLAKATSEEQENCVGSQTAGRVFLFLNTDNFWRDYKKMMKNGIKFVWQPKEEDYGLVAVFEDLYGNRWDLLQLKEDHPICQRMP